MSFCPMSTLHLIYGPQGAGKSTLALQLADTQRALRFSIDEWMGQLFGPDLPQPIDFGWIAERVHRCETRIRASAFDAVRRGCSAVLDLGFMTRASREAWTASARADGLTPRWHYVDAPLDERWARVASRNASRGSTFTFEVTPAMFDFMESRFEPPSPEELERAAIGPAVPA